MGLIRLDQERLLASTAGYEFERATAPGLVTKCRIKEGIDPSLGDVGYWRDRNEEATLVAEPYPRILPLHQEMRRPGAAGRTKRPKMFAPLSPRELQTLNKQNFPLLFLNKLAEVPLERKWDLTNAILITPQFDS